MKRHRLNTTKVKANIWIIIVWDGCFAPFVRNYIATQKISSKGKKEREKKTRVKNLP